jgi:hypothetical protein
VRRLLELLPGVSVRPIELDSTTSITRSDTDVLVLEETAPENSPAVPLLLIDPPARSWLPQREAEIGPSAWTVVRQLGAPPEPLNEALVDLRVETITRYATAAETRTIVGQARSAGDQDTLPLLLRQAQSSRGAPAPWALLPFSVEGSSLVHHEGFPELLISLVLELAGVGGPTVREPGVLEIAPSAVAGLPAARSTTFDLGPRHFAEIESPMLFAGSGRNAWSSVAPPGSATTAVNRTDWPRATELAGPVAAAAGRIPSWRGLLLAAALTLAAFELWSRNRGLTE